MEQLSQLYTSICQCGIILTVRLNLDATEFVLVFIIGVHLLVFIIGVHLLVFVYWYSLLVFIVGVHLLRKLTGGLPGCAHSHKTMGREKAKLHTIGEV